MRFNFAADAVFTGEGQFSIHQKKKSVAVVGERLRIYDVLNNIMQQSGLPFLQVEAS